MDYPIRLYLHHDNDLIQLYLNGVNIRKVFEQALSAYYNKENIHFVLPETMEIKEHKRRIYRLKISLDDVTQKNVITWISKFPAQYRNHCIKSIARRAFGTQLVDFMTGLHSDDPPKDEDNTKKQKDIVSPVLKKHAKKDIIEEEWIESVSKSKGKASGLQGKAAEEARAKIYNTPREELLDIKMPIESYKDVANDDHSTDSDILTQTDDLNDIQDDNYDDDFDASFILDQMRGQ